MKATLPWQLPGGESVVVHVFSTEEENDLSVDRAAEALTREELARADRFVFPDDRARWIRCRATVRTMLASRLGVSPPELEILQDPGTKPRVEGLEFNYSHSGGLGALAILDDMTPQGWCPGFSRSSTSDRLKPGHQLQQLSPTAIGVDVEVIRDDYPFLEIAADYFTESEIHALRACVPAELPWLFYRQWTAKEAVMKATGLGMSLEPTRLETRFTGEADGIVLRLDTLEVCPVRTWRLEDAVCTAAVTQA